MLARALKAPVVVFACPLLDLPLVIGYDGTNVHNRASAKSQHQRSRCRLTCALEERKVKTPVLGLHAPVPPCKPHDAHVSGPRGLNSRCVSEAWKYTSTSISQPPSSSSSSSPSARSMSASPLASPSSCGSRSRSGSPHAPASRSSSSSSTSPLPASAATSAAHVSHMTKCSCAAIELVCSRSYLKGKPDM